MHVPFIAPPKYRSQEKVTSTLGHRPLSTFPTLGTGTQKMPSYDASLMQGWHFDNWNLEHNSMKRALDSVSNIGWSGFGDDYTSLFLAGSSLCSYLGMSKWKHSCRRPARGGETAEHPFVERPVQISFLGLVAVLSR